jgi:TPR repeat protein
MSLLTLALIALSAVPPEMQPSIDACRSTGDAMACSRATMALLKEDPAQAAELALKGCVSDPDHCAVVNVVMALNEASRIEDGVELLGKACDQGYLMGCYLGGVARLEGTEQVYKDGKMVEAHVRPEPKRGVAMLDKACTQDVMNACYSLWAAYDAGKKIPADPAKARRYKARGRELAEKAHETNDAQSRIDDAATEKRLTEEAQKNAPKVAGWETDCTAGRVDACESLGTQFELSDPKKALDARIRALQLAPGSATAAILTWADRVGRKDPAASAEIYRRACDVSDASACGIGGLMLLKKQNQPAEGMKMLEKSCALGDDGWCKVVAGEYRGAPGVAKNTARAEEFERRAKTMADARIAREKKAQHDREEQERKLRPLTAELERLQAEQLQRIHTAQDNQQQRQKAMDAASKGEEVAIAGPLDSPDTRAIRRDLIHRMTIDLGLAEGAASHAFPEAPDPQKAIDCRNSCSGTFSSCLEGCDHGPASGYDACFEACGTRQQSCSNACPTLNP